jgi:hypothetical protein
VWRQLVWATKVVFVVAMGALSPGALPPEPPPRPRAQADADNGDEDSED